MNKRKITQALYKNAATETKDKQERNSDAEAMLDRFSAMVKTSSKNRAKSATPGGSQAVGLQTVCQGGREQLDFQNGS